ncbi:MAG: hypothetical protein ABIR17_03750 [Pseudolysinimonas sp.]|uniref:hypothetical protein n=1 Tax=Pseudolysinimonas sp. TaxID=2680009 RepID=UPI0032649153
MAKGDSGVDPRYAAQFQRGFQGEHVDPTSPPESAQRRAPVHLSGGRAATAQRVEQHSIPPSTVRSSAMQEESAGGVEVDADPLAIARPTRSERILFGGSAVLVVLSIWLFFQMMATATASSTQPTPAATDQLWLWAQAELPAPLLVGGIVAFCAGLVLAALRTRVR